MKKCEHVLDFYDREVVYELSENGFKEILLDEVYNEEPFLKVYWDGLATNNTGSKCYFISKEKAKQYVVRMFNKCKDSPHLMMFLDKLHDYAKILDMSEAKEIKNRICEIWVNDKKKKIKELANEISELTEEEIDKE